MARGIAISLAGISLQLGLLPFVWLGGGGAGVFAFASLVAVSFAVVGAAIEFGDSGPLEGRADCP